MKRFLLEFSSNKAIEVQKYINLANVCGVFLQTKPVGSEVPSPQLIVTSKHDPTSESELNTTVLTSQAGIAVEIFFSGTAKKSVVEEANFIRWINFLQSELFHFNDTSKAFRKSLQHLENILSNFAFLR